MSKPEKHQVEQNTEAQTEQQLSQDLTMSITIEKGIPVPPMRTRRKYDLATLEVGDSFVVAVEEAGSIRASVAHWAKKNGGSFVTRKTDEGVRVWRAA